MMTSDLFFCTARSDADASLRRGLVLGLGLWLWLLCTPASAETVYVPPGTDTLGQAIGAASDGDVLVLNGGYAGDVLIDKSLTLRSHNLRGEGIIVASSFRISAPGKSVSLHGLDIDATLLVEDGAEVRIVDNLLRRSIVTTNYDSNDGDGSLLIVGNWLYNGSISEVKSGNALIAGNTLERGQIKARPPVRLLGNSIQTFNSPTVIEIDTAAAQGDVYVIGNRLTLTVNWNSSTTHFGVEVNGNRGPVITLLAGNVIRFETTGGARYDRSSYPIYVGKTASNHHLLTHVINNVLDARDAEGQITGVTYSDLSAGNVVLGMSNDAIKLTTGQRAEHNICFNNGTDCGTDDGNLAVDPQFRGEADYRLAAGSPGIDAGSPSIRYQDLDLSRNDIGAYGGPWSIEQFDAQRDPNARGPYVYPLFDSQTVADDGHLRVRAIGIARFPR